MRQEVEIIGKLQESFIASVFSGLGVMHASLALDMETRERRSEDAMERGRLGRDRRAKKDGTNGLAVRAGRPVTQTTPGWEGI
jgi:hypothetical protein